MGQESRHGLVGSSAYISQAEIKTWRFWGRTPLQAHSGWHQNSLLCGCRTEVTFPWLVVVRGSPLAPVLAHGPLHLQKKKDAASPFHGLDL